jgi:hypothetical protein
MKTASCGRLVGALLASLIGAAATAQSVKDIERKYDWYDWNQACMQALADYPFGAEINDPAQARQDFPRDMIRLAADAEAFDQLEEGAAASPAVSPKNSDPVEELVAACLRAQPAGARSPGAADLAEAVERLGKLTPLSENQRSAARALEALQQLRDLTGDRAAAPDTAQLRRLLADLGGALPADEARRLRIDLALRLAIAGHTDAARELLPDAATATRVQKEARDVIKLIQVDRAKSPGAGRGTSGSSPTPPSPPVSPALPQPEGPRQGPRPSPEESALAAMPPLGLGTLAVLARQARDDSRPQREEYRKRARDTWERASTAYRPKPIRAIPPQQSAATSDTGGTAGLDDDSRKKDWEQFLDKAYLKEVEIQLGRPLVGVELRLALDLRRSGVSALEAARVIRLAASAKAEGAAAH